jgi:phosphoglucosamine mutase
MEQPTTPRVLRELGAEVFVFGNQPDGSNINDECGSMHPEKICQLVHQYRADLGIAHDGDADRVLLCDETGTKVDGDDIMAIAALDRIAQHTLTENTLVATVMSNAGLDAAIKAAGGHVVRTSVGDKNVIDEMLRGGYNFGGEQSGHLIFRDYSTTGDGLIATLQILRIMKVNNSRLSQLAHCWTRRSSGTCACAKKSRSRNWTECCSSSPTLRPKSSRAVAACSCAIRELNRKHGC